MSSTPFSAGAVRRAARASARRPKTVLALWLMLVAGCVTAGAMTGTQQLTEAESAVGESGRAYDDAGLERPAVETVLVRSSHAATTRAAAAALTERAQALESVAEVRGPADTPELSTADGRAVLVQVSLRGDPDTAADRVEPLERAVAATAAAHPRSTFQQAGAATLEGAFDDIVEEDLQSAELISLPIILLVLVVTFGALVAASVPLILGITSVAAALGAAGVVSQIVPDGATTASLIVLIGLAVGVDYSLFYIRREREERRAGRRPDAALEATAATVGRAVVVSGLTVIVALAGLLVTGITIFASLAVGTMVVVAVAVIGSVTVLPAVLALLGDRIDRGAEVAPGAQVLVTGEAAGSKDFTDRLDSSMPLVIGFVLTLAFVLLVVAFRSPALAAATTALNLLSVGATFGVLAATFDPVVDWIPLFTFVILFGLSMDYTVLVLERIREARAAGRSAREAAAEGVGATAGAVTSAAVVMVASSARSSDGR